MRGVIVSKPVAPSTPGTSTQNSQGFWAGVPGVLYPPPCVDDAPAAHPAAVAYKPSSRTWCSVQAAAEILRCTPAQAREACRRAGVRSLRFKCHVFLHRADVRKAAARRLPVVPSLLWDSIGQVAELLGCTCYTAKRRMHAAGIRSIRARLSYPDGSVSTTSFVLYDHLQIETTFS